MNILKLIDGYKTYIVAVGMILVGIVGLVVHYVDPASSLGMDPDIAMKMITTGLLAFAARSTAQKFIDQKPTP